MEYLEELSEDRETSYTLAERCSRDEFCWYQQFRPHRTRD